MRAFVLLASICCGAVFAQTTAHAEAAADLVWPTQQWQTATPEEQGMDSAALARLVTFGTTRSFDSLLIARHGRIVLDAYYAPYSADIPHAINSSTKAIVGTLTAIAYRDGLLDRFDHQMLDFFPDRSIANVDDRKKAITIQNLLDMTSGIEWEEGISGGREQSLIDLGRSANQVQFILDRPMAKAPGEVFYYDSGNPHLLSAILTKLTGMTARDYAIAKLFGPLGISTSSWRQDAQGLSTGGGGLALLPRDMAKIGYLYLRNGEWEGKQLLPPAWIERVNHATVNMNASFEPDLRYSNFFWAIPEKHVYMAVGYHCQVIMVMPEQDIVAVMTARNFCPFGRMTDFISGAVKSEAALPPDSASADLLTKAIHEVSTETPISAGAAPEAAAAISGKTYKFPDNALGIRSLSLTLAGPDPGYELEITNRSRAGSPTRVSGPIGLDGTYRKSTPTELGIIAVKGAWLDAHRFLIDAQYVGAGEQRQWALSFDGQQLTLGGKARDGHEVSIESEAPGSH